MKKQDMQIHTPDRIGETDGIIGVIGVAPWSTISFIRVIFEKVSAAKDWHYPRVICDFNTKIPSRGRHFELGEADFSFDIQNNIAQLEEQGADVIVVTCNTAHIYYDKWTKQSKVPVLNIMQAAVGSLKVNNSGLVAFLCGWSLRASGLYQKMFSASKMNYIELEDSEASNVAKIIEEIKHTGKVSANTWRQCELFFESLRNRGVDSVLLACTELSLLKECAQTYFKVVIDSNEALAEAAIKEAGLGSQRIVKN